MWFKLSGDARLGACASENCWGQPTWRLEAEGVGSNYCSGCKEKIEQPRQRRYILSGGQCVTCSQYTPGDGMLPPHDASDRCESGKRNHCTCDTCF